jgi:hypothetical protein
MREERRRRVASRERVLLACITSWGSVVGGEGRLRSNAAVARTNLGIFASLSAELIGPAESADAANDSNHHLLDASPK